MVVYIQTSQLLCPRMLGFFHCDIVWPILCSEEYMAIEHWNCAIVHANIFSPCVHVIHKCICYHMFTMCMCNPCNQHMSHVKQILETHAHGLWKFPTYLVVGTRITIINQLGLLDLLNLCSAAMWTVYNKTNKPCHSNKPYHWHKTCLCSCHLTSPETNGTNKHIYIYNYM